MGLINAVRSLLFNISFYGFNLIYLLIFMPPFVIAGHEPSLRRGIKIYCRVSLFLARWVMGIRTEWRNAELLPKEGALIIAAAHQSYMDPIMTYMLRSDVSALAKIELKKVPVIGAILSKIGITFVDRGKGSAHQQMTDIGRQLSEEGKPLIVYPQATRVKPGTRKALKAGAYHLHKDTGLPVYTVATTTGLFWSRGFMHRPGLAIFEVVRRLPDGLDKDAFMAAIDEDIVQRSDALYREVGYGHLIPSDDGEKDQSETTGRKSTT